jgi:hypothetical protein
MSVKYKRYNLVLLEDLFDQLQQVADDKDTTVAELLRRFIRLGLLAAKLEGVDGPTLFIREGATEQRILLL